MDEVLVTVEVGGRIGVEEAQDGFSIGVGSNEVVWNEVESEGSGIVDYVDALGDFEFPEKGGSTINGFRNV